MATFSQKPAAIIWAKDSDGTFHSVNGINATTSTDTNAVNQLNKVFALIGKTIVPDGMQLIITKEAN